MTFKNRLRTGAALALLTGLAACGGGSSSSNNSSSAPPADLAQTYASALAATGTPAGLSSPALKDSFAESFLDAGYTKAELVANVDADALALSQSTEFSAFPQLTLSDATITGCGADNVCTLSGTLTNGDADTTSVPFSVRVIRSDGAYRLHGDQQTS
jgi:hypothetical protein